MIKEKILAGALMLGTMGYCCSSTSLLTIPIVENNLKTAKQREIVDLNDAFNNVYGIKVNFEFEKKIGDLEAKVNFFSGGTGYALKQYGDDTYFLTNEHLVSGFLESVNPLIKQFDEKKRRYYVIDEFNENPIEGDNQLIYADSTKDIMVIRHNGKLERKITEFEKAKNMPKVGEEVYIVGYPRNVKKFMAKGIVGAECPDVDCFLNIAASEGSSGSPYFLMRDGKLYFAGIVNRIINAGGEKLPYAIGINAKNFYDDVIKAIEQDRRNRYDSNKNPASIKVVR